ncbi:MAG TPA: patatin-like phospholipase family protein [Spirochaetota bacterium]
MAKNITLLAGKNALRIISEEGVTRDNIRVIAGAAGGPKWLALSGIDRYLFGTFFKKRKDPLFLVGSSIGAWRFAAALQKNPVDAIGRFEDAYINQRYESKPDAATVTQESYRVLDAYLDGAAIRHILNHPFMRMSIIAARAKGCAASDTKLLLGAGLTKGVFLNAISRSLLRHSFERTLFSDPRTVVPFAGTSIFPTQSVPLTEENFRAAVMASGSIPLVMSGITNIPGARDGVYRDGGMIDYHLDFPFLPDERGLVLYPHFIPRIIPGWLDKSLPWRKPEKSTLDNLLLICPSESFVRKLPHGKIPDRNDFHTFFGRDKDRITFWEKVVRENRRIADEFGELIETGKIARAIRPFPE